MKFSKLILMPLLALSLVACNSTTTTSTPETSTPTTSTPTTSTPATDTAPSVATDWSEEEKALMKSMLNDNVLPYVTMPDAIWTTLDLDDGHGDYLAYVKQDATQETLDTYCEELLKVEGYTDLSAITGDPTYRMLIGPLANVEWHEQVWIDAMYLAETNMVIALYDYDIDVRTYDANYVNSAIEALFGVAVELPAPTFTFTDIDIYFDEDTGAIVIDMYTDTSKVETYTQTLQTASWTKTATDTYKDPTGSVQAFVEWYPDYECTTINITSLVSVE